MHSKVGQQDKSNKTMTTLHGYWDEVVGEAMYAKSPVSVYHGISGHRLLLPEFIQGTRKAELLEMTWNDAD